MAAATTKGIADQCVIPPSLGVTVSAPVSTPSRYPKNADQCPTHKPPPLGASVLETDACERTNFSPAQPSRNRNPDCREPQKIADQFADRGITRSERAYSDRQGDQRHSQNHAENQAGRALRDRRTGEKLLALAHSNRR